MGSQLLAYRSYDVQAAVAATLEGRPRDTLLRRAGAGLAAICTGLLADRYGGVYGRRVVLLTGSGHNGADALLAGAQLRERGAQVQAILTADTAYRPGVEEVERLGGRIVRSSEASAAPSVAAADLVVDGIVGDRGTPGLPSHLADLVGSIAPSAIVVAVDLPSGVDPDTGEVNGPHVRADVTVTFGTYKACLLAPPACYAAGQLRYVDVGISPKLPARPMMRRLTDRGVAARWPVPTQTSHKYTRGVLGVIAGSDTYPGAAVLAVTGAVRAGAAGIVRYIGPRRVTDHVLAAAPEAVPGIGRMQAWLLGSGVVDDADQDAAIATALESGQPCVVDAGALEVCVTQRAAGTRPAPASGVLLTPHTGELARVLRVLGHDVDRAQVDAAPLRHVQQAAAECDATVLLKGNTTLIASPDGPVSSVSAGPAWLATAGAGDVLAGIAGALLAAGVPAVDAGAMAATVHGKAASRASAGGPVSASDTVAALPAVVRELLAGQPAAACQATHVPPGAGPVTVDELTH